MSNEPPHERPDFWSPDLERDISDEIAAHVEMAERDLQRSGFNPRDAADRARARFGDVRRVSAECVAIDRAWLKEQRRSHMWADLRDDIRMAVRGGRRSPLAALVIVFSLALGLGAGAALFSLARGVLVRPLPYGDADRLVFVWSTTDRTARDTLTPGRLIDLRHALTSVDGLAGISQFSANITGGGESTRVNVASVSSPFFDLLRATPHVGGVFHSGAPDRLVVVISHTLWVDRFAANPSIVGQSIVINGVGRRVIGVMPETFTWPSIGPAGVGVLRPDAFVPAGPDDVPFTAAGATEGGLDRRASYLRAVARLADGATLEQAQQEAALAAARIAAMYPDTDAGVGVLLVPLRQQFFGRLENYLRVVGGAVAMVLIVVCVNVIHLLVAQTAGRQTELGIRHALGATPGRIIRQVLTEAAVLVTLGTAGAVLVALWAQRVFPVFVSVRGAERLPSGAFDLPVALFLAALGGTTAVICGAFPAWHVARGGVGRMIASQGSRNVRGVATRRVREGLVVAEIGLAVVALMGAALLLQSFRALSNVDLGLDTTRLLTFNVGLTGARGESTATRSAFFRDVLDVIRAQPGVEFAGVAATLPIGGDDFSSTFTVDGSSLPPAGQEHRAGMQAISPGYLTAVGMRLLAGRDVRDGDTAEAPHVALVNQTFAARYFPAADPIGQRIRLGRSADDPLVAVVGLVSDVRHLGPSEPARAEFYLPYTQRSFRTMAFVVRTSLEPEGIVPVMRSAVHRVDADQALANVTTMDALVEQVLARPKMLSSIVLSFGVLALTLAVMGIYGVMAWTVTERRQEMAVRLAIGATPFAVRRLIIRRSARLVVVGLVVGASAWALLGRSLEAMLFGVSPLDPMVCGAVTAVVMIAAMLGVAIPATRAGRIRAAEVLRG